MRYLAQRRNELGLTQRQVADALNVTQAAVAQWETGVFMPKGRYLLALADLLHCSVDDLLGRGGSPQENHTVREVT